MTSGSARWLPHLFHQLVDEIDVGVGPFKMLDLGVDGSHIGQSKPPPSVRASSTLRAISYLLKSPEIL